MLKRDIFLRVGAETVALISHEELTLFIYEKCKTDWWGSPLDEIIEHKTIVHGEWTFEVLADPKDSEHIREETDDAIKILKSIQEHPRVAKPLVLRLLSSVDCASRDIGRTSRGENCVNFVKKARKFYLSEGYSYKEATRHATADYHWWRQILGVDAPPGEMADFSEWEGIERDLKEKVNG